MEKSKNQRCFMRLHLIFLCFLFLLCLRRNITNIAVMNEFLIPDPPVLGLSTRVVWHIM